MWVATKIGAAQVSIIEPRPIVAGTEARIGSRCTSAAAPCGSSPPHETTRRNSEVLSLRGLIANELCLPEQAETRLFLFALRYFQISLALQGEVRWNVSGRCRWKRRLKSHDFGVTNMKASQFHRP